MSNIPPTPFDCSNCGANYKLVRVEAPAGPTTDRQIECLSCGGPLHGREGRFLLKYFLIERPGHRLQAQALRREHCRVIVTESAQIALGFSVLRESR